MPNTTRRLRFEQLANDEDVITAIKAMEDYTPAPGLPSIEALIAMNANVQQCDEANLHAQNIRLNYYLKWRLIFDEILMIVYRPAPNNYSTKKDGVSLLK